MIEAVYSVNEEIEAVVNSAVDLLAGGETVESQQVSVPNGATTITINILLAQPDLKYSVSKSWFNDTDPNPQFQSIIVTNKTMISFDFEWNSSTDTANYKIDYTIHRHNP